jgi:putative MATE family efflux protein
MQKQDHNHNVLDTSQIGRLLVKLSVPMVIGMSMQSIYTIVDTIFMGHYVGTLGIASLSVVFPIQMLTMGVGSMVSVGGASLISRLIGGSDHSRAERALGNSLFFSLVFSILLTILVLPGINFWMKIIGASEDVLPFAKIYLTITVSGTVFTMANSVLVSLVRAEGNARVNMIAMISQSGVAIILDAIFMIPLHMGIKGAALATVISQGISALYVLSYYLSGSSYLKIRWRNFIPDPKIVKSIFAIGVSQLASTIATSIATTFLVKMAGKYGGDDALGAFGIVQRILWLASMPSMVLGQAMQPILGFNYGAKRFVQALKTIKLAVFWATGFCLAVFAVFTLIPEQVVSVFTNDLQLISSGAFAVRRIFLSLPLFGLFNVGQQVFPSVGLAVPTFVIAVTRPLLLLTPCIIIFPIFLGISGVWLAFPGSDLLACLLTIGLLIPVLMKFRKAAAEQQRQTYPIPS